ncbi:MAG: signal peptidase I [Woeseiaceae bacterium]
MNPISEGNAENGGATRQLLPFNAAIAGVVGFGLGYLYVGRLKMSFLPIVSFFSLMLIVGATRAITVPIGVYLAYAAMLVVWLISIIHPAVIARREKDAETNSYNRGWVYLTWIIVVGLFISQVASYRGFLFGFEAYSIPSISMAPTLEKGDWIVADTWIYDDSAPAFGDLIVHGSPSDESIMYVKRLVGLPGDTIELRNNVLVRNGTSIEERFIQLNNSTRTHLTDFPPATVPAGHYFVLGDNRHNSMDSRFFGSVPKEMIIGRVEYRWFAYGDGVKWGRFPDVLAIDGS